MKSNIPKFLGGAAFCALLSSSASAQFDELQNYGDTRTDGGSPGSFTSDGSTHAITAGGGDFWGNSDNGSFLTASDGSLTTSSDFSASVRHVGTSDPSTNDWGREPLMMRAQPASGGGFDLANPANDFANSAHYMAYRRSALASVDAGWRDVAGAGTLDWARNGGPGFIDPGGRLNEVGAFLAIGRDGPNLHAGWAADLSFGTPGAGVAGRWFELNNRTHPSIGADSEVTIGIGHQSHNGITGGGNGQNTATYDSFAYDGAAFDPSLFGPQPDASYFVDGSWNLVDGGSSSGEIVGSAYTSEFGAATGEATGWKISARQLGAAIPLFGVANAVNDPTAIGDRTADLVPAANFRQGGEGSDSGLIAEIHMSANDGANQALSRNGTLGVPTGSTVIPDVWWTHPGGGPPNGYPDGIPGTNDQGGANTTNLFALAVPGSFSGNQDNYGVQMIGEIFVPNDGARGGREWIAFKDGVDDFTYLEVDGVPLIDDNSWTGVETDQNQGGAISLLDTSDSKYDDGEWVAFRMVAWEGGGGDTSALYWDLDGTSTLNQAAFPVALDVIAEYFAQGSTQVGSDLSEEPFPGVNLPAGLWNEVELTVLNTDTPLLTLGVSNVTVAPGGGRIEMTQFSFDKDANTIDLTFESDQGTFYQIEASENGIDWSEVIASGLIGQAGGETGVSGLSLSEPVRDKLLIRVAEQALQP